MDTTVHTNLYPNLISLGSAKGYAKEIYSIIDKVPLFGVLMHAEVDVLCEHMKCYTAPRGTVILKENDAGNHMILVLTGMIDIQKKELAVGGQGPIAKAGPGSMLGEMSFVDDRPRFASCVTTESTDFAVLTRADLEVIALSHPRFSNKFLFALLQLMVKRLRDTTNRLLPNASQVIV